MFNIDSSDFRSFVDSLSDGFAVVRNATITYSNSVMDSFIGSSALGRNPDECFAIPILKLGNGKYGDCLYIETNIRGTFGIIMLKRSDGYMIITFKPLNEKLDVARRARYLSTFDGKLRNTVTSAMMAVSSLVKNNCADTSEYRTFIHNCCKLLRLSGTVSMLSAESDAEVGFFLKTADLYQLLNSICRRISTPLNTLGIAMGFRSDKKHFVTLLCDDWIERAVLNLISHSVTRMKSGGRICIHLDDFEGMALIDVSDTGEPTQFYGKESDDADYACRDIVRRVVRAHGGSLVSTRLSNENHTAVVLPVITPSDPLLTIEHDEIESFIPYDFIELSDAFGSEQYDFADVPHNRKADK